MSLYNIMFGENADSNRLIQLLDNLKPLDIPRYRDCYLSDDKTKIIILTRSGGGNREEYGNLNDEMARHPCYLHDNDADFDSTYAEFHFSIPVEKSE